MIHKRMRFPQREGRKAPWARWGPFLQHRVFYIYRISHDCILHLVPDLKKDKTASLPSSNHDWYLSIPLPHPTKTGNKKMLSRPTLLTAYVLYSIYMYITCTSTICIHTYIYVYMIRTDTAHNSTLIFQQSSASPKYDSYGGRTLKPTLRDLFFCLPISV